MPIMRRFAAIFIALAAIGGAPALAQQYSSSFTFFKAVKEGDAMKAKSVIDQPGSTIINMRNSDSGETALIMVTGRRDAPWMSFLIANGADVNGRAADGDTALIRAAEIGFAEGVDVLLSRGANVNVANESGETPLILAVQRRNLPAARTLLAAGADPDIADNAAGLSARDYASRDPRAAAIAKLIENGQAKRKSVMGPTRPD